jgi:BirA family transcriptional regulator, biotin operon repressor / biotin---[acetyl-CoA-carboxylase] ligase
MIRTVAVTGSTNDDVLGIARSGGAEGLWLRAERQTGGKGRQGRQWQSPPGNLYASTLVRLRPGDPPAPSLALVAAVALHDTVALQVPEARIKWPNDLLAGPAKLAGILLERADDAVVIGFGVNLAFHPEQLDRPTTSVAALIGAAPDPAVLVDWLADASRRPAPPGSPRRIRPAPRFSPAPAKGCSTALPTPARCACAWRMAPPMSFTPATSS